MPKRLHSPKSWTLSRRFRSGLAALALAGALTFAPSGSAWALPLPVDPRITVSATQANYPGADAVLMLDDIRFDVRPDRSHIFDEHDAVKVLTPNGVDENATLTRIVDVSEAEIEVVTARTIKADGRVVPAPPAVLDTLAKDSELYSSIKRFSLRFPDVEVGDAVEFHIRTVHKPKPGGHFWATTYVENPMPISDSSFTATIPKGIYFQAAAPGMTDGKPKKEEIEIDGVDYRRLSWKVQNQSAFTQQPLAPTTLSLLTRIEVSSFKNWEEVASYIGDAWKAKSRISEGLALRVAGWLPESSDTGERARAVLKELGRGRKAVSFLSEGPQFHKPSQVFPEKIASLEDVSLLASVALSTAGIPNVPVATIGVSSESLKDELPHPEKVERIVLQIPLPNGDSYWVDPESVGFLLDEPPSGTSDTAVLSWDSRFLGGVVGVQDLQPASAFANREELAVEGRLERNGRAELTLQFDRYGGEALNARQAARDIAEGSRGMRDRALESFFDSAAQTYGDRARLLGRYFETDPEVSDPFSLSFTVTVPGFGRPEGDTLLVPLPRFLSANIRAASNEKSRVIPLRFDQPYQQDVRIHLLFPEGSTVAEAPLQIEKKTPEAEFVATGRAEGNEVWYVGRLTVNDPWIDASALASAMDVLSTAINSENTVITVNLPAEAQADHKDAEDEDEEG